MATEAGELIVKISGDISDIKNQLQDMGGRMQGFGASTVAAGNIMADAFKRAGAAVVDFVKESVLSFAEHEQAMTRLSLAIGTDGAHALQAYANELQRTTAFSDDAILSLENQLVQYGIYPGSVKQATAALLDFSARTGKDLPEAGQMLAKAMAGQSRELKNYGVDVSLTASRSQNLATVTKFLEDNMKGAAAAMKGTTLGAIDSLKNSFGDLQKQLGELLAPTINKVVQGLTSLVGSVNVAIRAHRGYSDTLEDQKQKLADLVAMMKGQVSNGVDVTNQQKAEMEALVKHIKVMQQAIKSKNDLHGATDREIASIRSLKDEILKLQQEQQHLSEITTLTTQKRLLGEQMALEQMHADEQKITEFTNLETAKRMETSKSSWEANASFSDQFKVKLADDASKNTAAWVGMAGTMIDSFSSSTAKMIMEGGRFSQVLQNLWKQMAEMVIQQILRMIAEWLVWEALTGGAGGFGGGFLGHGAAGGMINEPSMVIGMRSGSSFVAGEAGPEAFGPAGTMNTLNRGSAQSGGSGGGGSGGDSNVTINISGQFIEGNPSKWQRMVQEQIAPQIRRLAMKDPSSLITRKRGSLS